MSKYWILVDNHKVGTIETDHEMTEKEIKNATYEYAKSNGLHMFGLKGVQISKVQIFKAQTQEDMPIYKLRQSA